MWVMYELNLFVEKITKGVKKVYSETCCTFMGVPTTFGKVR